MSDDPKEVFKVLQKEFLGNVDLETLVPSLNKQRLLTDSEEEDLTNGMYSHQNRVQKLTQFLRRKGPSCPATVLCCLRDAGGSGHAHLANLMEAFLQRQGRSSTSDHGSSSCGGQESSEPRSRRNEQQSHELGPQNPPGPDPTHSSLHLLGPQNPPGPDPPHPLSSLHLPYLQLISDLSDSLAQAEITLPAIKDALQGILWNEGISLTLSDEVSDFRGLCSYLERMRMCNEADVDILIKLFAALQLESLSRQVQEYAMSIMSVDVMQYHDHTPSDDNGGQLLIFSHHNHSRMNIGQVYRVKDFLAHVLNVPRHTFCFIGPRVGSIVLVWQFPAQYWKSCLTAFGDAEVQSQLALHAGGHFTSIKLFHPIHGERTPFRLGADNTPASSIASQSDSHSRRSPEVEGEDAVSSTTTEPAPSEKCGDSSVTVGTKRSASPTSTADMSIPPPKFRQAEPHRESRTRGGSAAEHTLPTMSTLGQSSRKRPSEVAQVESTVHSAPPPKKRAAQSLSQKGMCSPGRFRETSPQEFSSQYVQESTFRAQEVSYYGPQGSSSKGSSSQDEHDTADPMKKYQPELVKRINLLALIPHLNQHDLLTDHENEELQNTHFTEYQRILRLISFVRKKGTEGYKKFLKALQDEKEHLGHRELLEILSSSSVLHEATARKDPLRILADLLKSTYTRRNFYQRTAGPNIGRIAFIQLALIMKQKASEEEKQSDDFLKSTLHGLVEDIAKKKESIDMYEIFEYGNHSRKLVLVEGAPGVGKTMLAMKLCEDWARGKALQEYDLVILVPLRRFQASESSVTVQDLLNLYLEGDLATQATQGLVANGGKKVMLFLEGWDELSPGLRQEFTFFFDIIDGTKLPNASVMVTSRPSVTAPLYDYMDERRVEVLGFNQSHIERFVHENAKDRAKTVLDHLKQFPNLRALAHIPLTLVIICFVVEQTSFLPPTLTELYDQYNLKKQPEMEFRTLIGLNALSDLPGKAPQVVSALSKLALQGFEDKAFVLHTEQLQKVGLNPTGSFDGYGLLSTSFKSATAGYEKLYQFRHLSIQEFLAALQITQLPDDSRNQLLKEYRSDKQFQNVWKFLAGITKLQDEEFQSLIVSSTGSANRDQLFLLHCLFEAHNAEICRKAAEKLNRTLNLNNLTLNTTDCLSAVYTIAAAEGEWNLDLRGCNIRADGLEVFKEHLVTNVTPELKITSLNLMHNRLKVAAMHHLAEVMRANVHLIEVNLGSNTIQDEGARVLADALTTNETVKSLHFSHCGFTHVAAEAFAEMLKQNKTLKSLYLGFEPIKDVGVIHLASALMHNETLTELSLTKTDFGHLGLRQLAEMLKTNKTLEVIRFDRDNLTSKECEVLAKIIETNEKLVLIDLSKNPIGDDGFSIIMDALIARPQGPLKKLGVFGCDITGKALQKLVDFFAVTETFEGIQLGCNPLGDEGAEYLAKALSQNASKSVKQVLLESTKISEKGKKLLAEATNGRENLDVNFMHHAQVIQKRLNECLN